MAKFLERFMRASETRTLKKLEIIAKQINDIEDDFSSLTDEELRGETSKFKERLARGESLDSLLPEAFAAVREASKRTLGKSHFDVQLMGGAALHFGNVAEMKTGEGKTLVATLPSYLNALTGKGVHVVTTNDYLAEYQSELMGRVHRALGLETGVILTTMTPAQRREQYAKDITYGTNNEFGFDYLRDNMADSPKDFVQREHYFAIVDEVDSILIDEARTPLIISGPGEAADKWYSEMARIVKKLERAKDEDAREGDYDVNEKDYTVALRPSGIKKVEDWLGIDNLYLEKNMGLVGHVNNALKAKELYTGDKSYVVLEGEVRIVDEHTGRILPGRRYSEGLHQAIEAKEGVEVMSENQTFATITLQNYFRMYDKLAGMTGTAQTEASELHQIYKLGVVSIPTNMPLAREDHSDLVYRTEAAKYAAIVEDIEERHALGQPILIGTTSVGKSEYLSKLLRKKGIRHEVLNAKYHEQEAAIIARAGLKNAVTVATNMAGRGTDIMLGGNPEFIAVEELKARGLSPEEDGEAYEKAWDEVLEAAEKAVEEAHEEVLELGGLYVLGTERHESRRIDNQLRGRAGRQGDPGASRFYISLQDDLMRLFNAELADRFLAPADEGVPLESKFLSRAIQTAQGGIEGKNFEIRKNILKYDDVLNRQREQIYGDRRRVLEGMDLKNEIENFMDEVIETTVQRVTSRGFSDDWPLEALFEEMKAIYPVTFSLEELEAEVDGRGNLSEAVLFKAFKDDAHKSYGIRMAALGSSDDARIIERLVFAAALDKKWREHLNEVDYLKEGITLRQFAQRDPLVEYQKEAAILFEEMKASFKVFVVQLLFFADITRNEVEEEVTEPQELVFTSPDEEGEPQEVVVAEGVTPTDEEVEKAT